MENIKNKNGFLIACVSCIVLLLTMCYFGISTSSTLKGTSAAGTCSGSTPNEIDGYCCPNATDHIETIGGTNYCVKSGMQLKSGGASGYYCIATVSFAGVKIVPVPDTYCASRLGSAWKGTSSGACNAKDPYAVDKEGDCTCQSSYGYEYCATVSTAAVTEKACYSCGGTSGGNFVWGDVNTYNNSSNCIPQPTYTTQRDCEANNYGCFKCGNVYAWAKKTDYTNRVNSGTCTALNYNQSTCITYAADDNDKHIVTFIVDGVTKATWPCLQNDSGACDENIPATIDGFNVNSDDWYSSSSCNGKPQNPVGNLVSTSLTFYRCTNMAKYKVTYDANGGSANKDYETIEQGKSVTLPTATRSGYDFKGWYNAATGGTKVGDVGSSYTPTSNITLHAQWTEKSSGGSEIGNTCGETNYGTWTKDSCDAYHVAGYCHLWDSKNQCCKKTQGDCGSGGGIPTEKTFTATFNENGGTLKGVETKSCSTTSSSCTIYDLPTATKSGYTFEGWGTSSSCKSGSTSSLTLTDDDTYYACWVAENTPDDEPDNSKDNVEENPGTGEIAIFIVWVIGLSAIVYSLWYFRKVKQN